MSLPKLLPLPHPSHGLARRSPSCPRCGAAADDPAIREQCPAVPALVPLTVDSSPELWAEQHKAVTDHEAQVSAWGAVCSCGAVWTRDPTKGGPARRGEREQESAK